MRYKAQKIQLCIILLLTCFLNPQQTFGDEDVLKGHWANGQIKSEEPTIDGKREGIARYWHDNGVKYADIPWQGGQKHGAFKIYSDKGVLQQALSYKDGKKDGWFTWFDEEGRMTVGQHYMNDMLHGVSEWYYEDGRVKTEEYYQYNQLQGETKWYDQNGNVMDEVINDKGRSKKTGISNWHWTDLIVYLDDFAWLIILLIYFVFGSKKIFKGKKTATEKPSGLEKLFPKLNIKMEEAEQKLSSQKGGEEDLPEEFTMEQVVSSVQPLPQRHVSEQEWLDTCFKKAKIFGYSCVIGIFALGAIVVLLFQSQGAAADMNMEEIKKLRSLFSFIIVCELIATYFIRSKMSNPAIQLIVVTKGVSTDHGAITKMLMTDIIFLVGCFSAAILGFVLALQTQNMNDYLFFGCFALLAIGTNWPNLSKWDYYIIENKANR